METSESDPWSLLRIFASNTRIEIVKLLLKHEMLSLSDLVTQLGKRGPKMSLPGLLKHMSILEDAGIVRKESGWIVDDARKALYLLEGGERVEKILQHLENNVNILLRAGEMFVKASKLARKIESFGPKMLREERRAFESLLSLCESQQIFDMLTEDERKKVKIWKMTMTF